MIIFAIDKRFGLVAIGHSGLGGSTTVTGQEAGSRSAVSFTHGSSCLTSVRNQLNNLRTYLLAYLITYLLAYLLTYLLAYLLACLLA